MYRTNGSENDDLNELSQNNLYEVCQTTMLLEKF